MILYSRRGGDLGVIEKSRTIVVVIEIEERHHR
jgi:hypothetical protein